MLESFQKVKNAISKISPGALSTIMVKDGFMYASDGRLSAGAPVTCKENFAVNADSFERMLKAIQHPEVVIGDTQVTFKKGRSRVKISKIPFEEVSVQTPTRQAVKPTPPGFIDKIGKASKFIGDDHILTWQCGVTIFEKGAWATNGTYLIRVAIDDFEDSFAIPDYATKYLGGRVEKVTHYELEKHCFTLFYDDDSWVRVTRQEDERMDNYARIYKNAYKEPSFKIPDALRVAYATVMNFNSEVVEIGPTEIVMRDGSAEVNAEVATGISKVTTWSPKKMAVVLMHAKFLDFESWPSPSSWMGDGCLGLIIGRQ